MDQIKTQLLLPKLNDAVVKWDPLRETIPIHTWIHPWLTILKDGLQPVYIPIRQKLMNALQHWHPSDGSAQAILSPWHNVFDEPSWDQVMVRCIVPKLLYVMQVLVSSFKVNVSVDLISLFGCVSCRNSRSIQPIR